MITLNDGHSVGCPNFCYVIESDDGRDLLIQSDWDYPSTASSFGWSINSIQKCLYCGKPFIIGNEPDECEECEHGSCGRADKCEHDETDGTVDCKECGLTASDFITAASDWLDDNIGATADDPGYFDGLDD